MGRPKRAAAGGWIYHVLNRANARTPIFSSPNDLVVRAEEWRWSSLYRWYCGTPEQKSLLASWPVRRSAGWVEHVNSPQTDEELSAIQRSIDRGCPFGDNSWLAETAKALGLEITTRPRGRPKIHKNGS